MDTIQDQAVTLEDDDDRRTRDEKFFITPGLKEVVTQFLAHYKTAAHDKAARDEPIMIVGDTGVGKSLFLQISKILYRQEHPNENINPIRKANCAHFGGAQSDPNVARAELFGSREGTATGIEDKDGCVKDADDGLLILEEIGELPLEVQAMLLTFIETGEYWPLGGQKDNANVKIIGATNNEEALRPDFRYRFFPFYVPSLFSRRGDVLYYLQHEFPEIIETLAPWEVTALLAHNWPGNVREVQQVGRLLRRRQKIKESESKLFELFPLPDKKRFLVHLDREVTSLNAKMVLNFYDFLKENEINVELVENILNLYRIGLSFHSSRKAFPGFPKEGLGYEQDPNRKMTGNLGIPEIPYYYPFESARLGLEGILCPLIYQNNKANNNLLDIWNGPSTRVIAPFSADMITSGLAKLEGVLCALIYQNNKANNKLLDIRNGPSTRVIAPFSEDMITPGLAKSCFEALSGITLSQEDYFPYFVWERAKYFKELAKRYPDNEFLASFGFAPGLKKKGKN